jgi:long-subunit fatty acid transport protein
MKRLWILGLIGLAVAAEPSQAQFLRNVSKVGTTSATFLSIEVGARPLAMGGAFVAVADEATALYWNPAGIARLGRTEATFTHTEWLVGSRFDYAGLVLPLGDSGTLGLSFTSLSAGEMEVRTVALPEGTGERFNANDIALGISYARNLTDRFSIGFSGKYVRQQIWHMSAGAFAFDVGTLYTTRLRGMRIGMSISNFGNKMRLEGRDTIVQHDIDPTKAGNNDKIRAHLDTEKWSLPLMFRVGVAMELMQTASNRLTVAVDAMHPNDNVEGVNLGAEYSLNDVVFLRAGYKSLFVTDSEEGLTLGAGLSYRFLGRARIKLDYAYADFGVLDTVQRFSMAVSF